MRGGAWRGDDKDNVRTENKYKARTTRESKDAVGISQRGGMLSPIHRPALGSACASQIGMHVHILESCSKGSAYIHTSI